MLKIGGLELAGPFVQAALSGYSDRAMRRVARRLGAPYTLNEVVLDELVIRKGKTRRRVLHVAEDDHPIGGQLLEAGPEEFERAAVELVEAGYDVVDLNFGCPVRKVLGRCRGGYLLSQPATALAIVRAVVAAVDGRAPVTVKMRRGMDASRESQQHFWEIFDGAWAAGVAAITVHGRTVVQRYQGPSDWAFLTEVKKRAHGQIRWCWAVGTCSVPGMACG